MKWSTTILLLSVLSCAAVAGDPPKPDAPSPPIAARPMQPEAVIVGPAVAEWGDIITLDASQSGVIGAEGETIPAKYFAWAVVPDSDERQTIMPINGGKQCQLASWPGTYTVFLAVGINGPNDLVSWTVIVRRGDDDPPGPGPDPKPPDPKPPGPDPKPPDPEPDDLPKPLPDGEYGLAQLAFDWAKPIKTERNAAKLLAEAFMLTATQIEAGALRTREKIREGMQENNGAAMSEKAAKVWASWDVAFGEHLAGLVREGTVYEPAEFAVAFREVATGLNAVK